MEEALQLQEIPQCIGLRRRKSGPGARHRASPAQGVNNRAEASHRHTRRREKIMCCLRHPAKRNGTCRFTTNPPPCFAPNAIDFQPDPIVTPAPMPSIFGLYMHTRCRPEISAPTHSSRQLKITGQCHSNCVGNDLTSKAKTFQAWNVGRNLHPERIAP